ncbi:hypothetical protein [Enterococcus phage Bp29]|uniref:Uncharacterized protein n=1 Tax=Enterococcus phage vB_EfaS-DELF1 TaxID=2683673 RepID=A0A5S9MN01_9CAUD|nr:hypothetical protein [Enterococcus phage Bp29]BBQ04335.1 hypothetical protein [Enterococcus phage vB_EfaS-DELF1]
MKSDKQLLQLTKTDLLEEYRKLESSKSNREITLNEAIDIVKSNGYVVKPKTSYDF